MTARFAGAVSGALFTTRAAAALVVPLQAAAQGKGEVCVALSCSKTGPLEAYGKQTANGFKMGSEYDKGGTERVGGKKIEVIEKDEQGKTNGGQGLDGNAYGDEKGDEHGGRE